MADPRLDSCHLGLDPRRHHFRRARDAVLEGRGHLTMAVEWFSGAVGPADDWPSLLVPRPKDVLPGTAFLLVDQATNGRHPLKVGLNTIGRHPRNDVVLDEHFISRRHCVIVVHTSGRAELHDLASRNGTLLNGRRLRGPVGLGSGDLIQLCSRVFLFVSEKDDRGVMADDGGPATGLY